MALLPVYGYQFGPFRLDCRMRRLLRDEQLMPVTGKAFEVLHALVQRRGQLVEKDELLRLIWPDVVVEEANLAQHIFTLRKLLGDTSRNARYIVTSPRRGYRFVADVAELRDDELAAGFDGGDGRLAPIVRSLAVLPFAPIMAGDEEFLGLALADAVIARLAKLAKVIVRPTSAIRRYTQPPDDLVTVARALRVDAVLEGTIRRAGDRIRVTVQLVHARSSAPLWAEQFDTAVADLFTVEDSISARVAGSLVDRLTGEEQRRLSRHDTESADAYVAQLKARFFTNRRTPDNQRRAVELFNQAIQHDPTYALAYSGLADCYALGGAQSLPRHESIRLAKAAARKAIELDDLLAEAHASLASLAFRWDWDWPAAEREFQRAIALNPSAASVRHAYGLFLAVMCRFDEALAEMEKAGEYDPLSLVISAGIGRVLDLAGRYDDAIGQYEKTADTDPGFAEAYFDLAMVYRHLKRFDEAIAAGQRAVSLAPDKPTYRADLALSCALAGRRAEAQAALQWLQTIPVRNAVSPVDIALVCFGLGDTDAALTLMEQAVMQRAAEVVYFVVDPDFRPLRAHPQFDALIRQIGLPASD